LRQIRWAVSLEDSLSGIDYVSGTPKLGVDCEFIASSLAVYARGYRCEYL